MILAEPSRSQERVPVVTIGAYDETDIRLIAANMRAADRREVAQAQAVAPEPALRRSVRLSHNVLAGRVDGVPACLFGLGVGVSAARIARPWLLGTDLVERHRVAFLRRNRDVVQGWLTDWELLENWVSDEHYKAQVWLRWLGFVVDEPAPFGPFGYKFRRFHLSRERFFEKVLPCA